jgi:single-stranded DNA-binding protein
MEAPVSLNKTVLVGRIADRGVALSALDRGTAVASFRLELAEVGSDGKVYYCYVPCEVLGKRAEATATLAPGTLVCLDGKLRWYRGEGEGKGYLGVQGWAVTVLEARQASHASRN